MIEMRWIVKPNGERWLQYRPMSVSEPRIMIADGVEYIDYSFRYEWITVPEVME